MVSLLYVTHCLFFFFFLSIVMISLLSSQIAAKIGGDGVAGGPTSDFGYGGQKRPLEDAGGYFPMPNLNTGQWLKSLSASPVLACFYKYK